MTMELLACEDGDIVLIAEDSDKPREAVGMYHGSFAIQIKQQILSWLSGGTHVEISRLTVSDFCRGGPVYSETAMEWEKGK